MWEKAFNCEKHRNSIIRSKIKELAKAIVVLRLEYSLEVTSTGRAKDMQDLQYVKVKLARWALGERRIG